MSATRTQTLFLVEHSPFANVSGLNVTSGCVVVASQLCKSGKDMSPTEKLSSGTASSIRLPLHMLTRVSPGHAPLHWKALLFSGDGGHGQVPFGVGIVWKRNCGTMLPRIAEGRHTQSTVYLMRVICVL